MNPNPPSETEALRSEIEMTRRRMDNTIAALGQRVRGRHLIDEVIGLFRSNTDRAAETGMPGGEARSQTAGSISEAAGNITNAVVDTVKRNPLPLLMIAAGAAWLAYSVTRGRAPDATEDSTDSDPYDPDTHYDRPLAYPGGARSAVGEPVADLTDDENSKFSPLKDKAVAARDQVKEQLSGLSAATRAKFQSAKERVARTVDNHPLEIGVGCLAAGVLIGLAIPTPEPVERLAGPALDRLRGKARDASREVLEKGKRVVQAATNSAPAEAPQSCPKSNPQPESSAAVTANGENADPESMRDDRTPGAGFENNTGAGAEPVDPSAAPPAM